MNQRELARERTRAAIMAAARDEVARGGGVGLSMRAIAREVGVVSSAIYRYFPTREALLTAMILESYQSLGEALSPPDGVTASERWRWLATTFRSWALAHPHEYQLIYGTPIPDYQAPPETIPAAAAVAGPFLATAAGAPNAAYAGIDVGEGIGATGEPSGVAAVVAELASLVGLVNLELSGHFVGVVASPERFFAAAVERQIATLALT